jgi:hypothetical protein
VRREEEERGDERRRGFYIGIAAWDEKWWWSRYNWQPAANTSLPHTLFLALMNKTNTYSHV